MPICKNCGIKGKIFDRSIFRQHGYPKDGQIRLSCLTCGSEDQVKNTYWENFWFYVEWGILCILFSWILVPAFFYVKFMRGDNYDE